MNENIVDAAVDCFDRQYRERGMRAQRTYPNESLIQFLASRFFNLPVEDRKNIRVLEIGCGTGANLWMMAKEGFQVYGIDSSAAAIDLAQRHLRDKWGVSAMLTVGTFTDLPYDGGYFDAVVDIVSLQHMSIADTKKALAQIGRVLKPNGVFFSYRLSDHSVMYSDTRAERADASTLLNIDDPTMPLANNGPVAFWSPSLARLLYEQACFELVSTERFSRSYSNGALVEYLALVAEKTIAE